MEEVKQEEFNIFDKLIEGNDPTYQLVKACEELSELTTALLQYVNKRGKTTTEQDVIVEIADVKIRMEVLERVFDSNKIKEAYDSKIEKLSKWTINGDYTNM